MRYLVLSLTVIFLSEAAQANSISEAYDEAFANPWNFDNALKNSGPAFYGQFAACAELAVPALAKQEAILRAQHKACDNNAQCAALAKEIGYVAEAKENVRALAAYLDARRGGSNPAYAYSEAGKRAIPPLEYAMTVTKMSRTQITAFMRQSTPSYRGIVAGLASLPCP